LVTKADIDAKLESGLLQAYVALSMAWRAHGEDANGSVCGSKCDSCSEAAVAKKAMVGCWCLAVLSALVKATATWKAIKAHKGVLQWS
jgi:hypothetical protein